MKTRALFFFHSLALLACLSVTSAVAADIEAYKAAIGSADLAELRRLLKADGAAVPRADDGSTVLHLAASGIAWRDRSGAIAAVLAAGVDPNLANDRGFTPLHYAASTDCGDCVTALLSAGAKVDARRFDGRTPLHHCSEEALTLLLAAGADLKVRDDQGRTVLHTAALIDPRLLVLGVNTPDRSGFRPLHYAALSGADERVRWLLDHGADPSIESTADFSNRSEIDVKAFDSELLEYPAGTRAYDVARERHDRTKWSTGRYRTTLDLLEAATPRRGLFRR